MRILIVNWNDRENPQGGGAEVHLHEIFGRIASRGHTVDLLASGWHGCAPRASLDGIDVHRVGTRYTFPLHARRYFRRHLASRNYDVLIEDLNKIPLYTPLWGGPRVVALVHHFFGETVFREANAPMAATVWLAERGLPLLYRGLPFVAVSESTADDLVSRGIPRESVSVIYNGIDPELFTPEPDARAPEPLFAYIGRLKKYKGIDIVVRSFAALGHPTARLEIAGTGDYLVDLQRLVESLGIAARVVFRNYITTEEKVALLRRAWSTVLASPKEGWGITNLEAAACGTPVIASDSPGLRESVVHGETGFLVTHGDVAAFAAAMSKVANSPALVERLGAAGRRFAGRFTWERSATDTLSHLTDVVQRGKQ